MDNILLKLPKDYRNDIRKAIKILKDEGSLEIYIFGSLVQGNFKKNSDIDIAVKGLPKGKYFEIGGKLMMELEHNFDLIKIDDENNRFADYIKKNEELIRVA